jgi:hypothetical protein
LVVNLVVWFRGKEEERERKPNFGLWAVIYFTGGLCVSRQ